MHIKEFYEKIEIDLTEGFWQQLQERFSCLHLALVSPPKAEETLAYLHGIESKLNQWVGKLEYELLKATEQKEIIKAKILLEEASKLEKSNKETREALFYQHAEFLAAKNVEDETSSFLSFLNKQLSTVFSTCATLRRKVKEV